MTYDTPFKLRVLKAIADGMREISPANGYRMSLVGDEAHPERVFRGRAWYTEDDPIPMLSILDDPDPAALVGLPPPNKAVGEYDWGLLFQGWVNDDPVNPTDPAHFLLADVRRRLAQELEPKEINGRRVLDIFGFGSGANRITQMVISSGVVRPADDVSSTAWFWLKVIPRIVENASKPYE